MIDFNFLVVMDFDVMLEMFDMQVWFAGFIFFLVIVEDFFLECSKVEDFDVISYEWKLEGSFFKGFQGFTLGFLDFVEDDIVDLDVINGFIDFFE